MAAIAQNAMSTMLASAEIDCLGLRRIELYGREVRALMTAVAKGLVCAAPTGTPVVALPGFNGNGIGTFLRNDWF